MSETDETQSALGRFGDRITGFRDRIAEKPGQLRIYRIVVGVIGTLVLAGGIVAIPYPGPGWLIVFAGLAILGSEFMWAKRVLRFARGKYDAWTDWLGRQNLFVKLLVLTATGLIVLATLWLLNALYLVAGWVGLDGWTWLKSPILG
ncbi:TIGR02611 family protein [Pseudonocardia sp.]|uniref:TIGR02611 family protein n=1 Tax=Pseudonocardia sp. TaxID=60912 RepID=UPI00260D28C1|nr:TIGR02611 family protein [Pseudonocardia sp.]